MVVMFISCLAHVNYKPFCEDWLNRFEFLSLLSSSLTFLLGNFTLDAGESGSVFIWSSLCALLVNAIYLISVILYGYFVLREEKQADKAQQQRKSETEKAEAVIELQKIQLNPAETFLDSSSPEQKHECVQAVTSPETVAEPNHGESVVFTSSLSLSSDQTQISKPNKSNNQTKSTVPSTAILSTQNQPGLGSKKEISPSLEPVNAALSRAGQQAMVNKKVFVIAKADFTSSKANQLSFKKGDTIQQLSNTGNWHRGVLTRSSFYPLTGKALFYPSNYVKASHIDKHTIRLEKAALSGTTQPAEAARAAGTKPSLMVARGEYLYYITFLTNWIMLSYILTVIFNIHIFVSYHICRFFYCQE